MTIMSVRDIEREREIEAMDDIAALKRSRSSRRGQITKVEKDMDKYLATPIVGLKKRILESSLHTLENQHRYYNLIQDRIMAVLLATPIVGLKKRILESSLHTLENQHRYYNLIQDRIMAVLQGSIDASDRVNPKDQEALEAEDIIGDDGLTTTQALKHQLQDLIKAVDAMTTAKRLQAKLQMFSDSDSVGDLDIQAKLQAMEPYIDELLDVSAELPEIKEITSLIKEVHLSYRQFTKESLRALPVKEPESSKDVRSPSVQQYKLPKTDMPVFEGDPKLWRRFWERFNQRISMYPGIPAAEKIAQLEQAIKPPDGRALICAPKGTEEEYDTSVKALQQRYDQPRRIYRSYIHDTFEHNTPRTRKGLYELSTRLQETMTALKLYGGMDASSVVVAAAEKGLNKETMLEWSAHAARKKLDPTMENFRAFITRKAEELDEEELRQLLHLPEQQTVTNSSRELHQPDPTPTIMDEELQRIQF